MFGLPSFSKLLLLALIIGGVWYGFRWISKMQQERDAALKAAKDGQKDRKRAGYRGGEDDVEEMVKDPKTGHYVPKSSLKDD